jgi:hypothetical protein
VPVLEVSFLPSEGRIALVGCETDKSSPSGTSAEITSLTQSNLLLIFLKNYNYYHPYPLFELTHSRALQSVAKRLYDSGNGAINAEVTGRTTQIEVNADGTKTMLTGGTKTVYSWDTDKGGIVSIVQDTKAIRPCSVCSILSFVCKSVIWVASCSAPIAVISDP